MATFFGLGGTDFYSGQDYQNQYGSFKPLQYGGFDPSSYGGGMGANYQGATNQMLSGQLSPVQQQQMDKQLGQGIESVRNSAYGMPVGAERGQEMGAVNQNALNAGLLGQQNIQTGMNAAMPYMQMGQQQSQFGYNAQVQQQSQQLQQQQFMAQLQQQSQIAESQQQDVGGQLLGAATSFGMGKLFPSAQDNYYSKLLGQGGSGGGYDGSNTSNYGLSLSGRN